VRFESLEYLSKGRIQIQVGKVEINKHKQANKVIGLEVIRNFYSLIIIEV